MFVTLFIQLFNIRIKRNIIEIEIDFFNLLTIIGLTKFLESIIYETKKI